jgi:diadenosine tetraphosphate (Ap4A) HIT family hydrolase
MSARGFALRVARRAWAGALISFAIRHFSWALPLRKICADADVVAFFHPAPSYDPHILIVPRRRARTVFALPEPCFRAALRVGAVLARQYEAPLQLRINGGDRQEVAQAHFHLCPCGTLNARRMGSYPAALAHARGARWFSLIVPIDGRTGGAKGIFIERD